MINLIKNEITKIFKKKSIYITLIIALLFVILTNVLSKYGDKLGNNDSYYSDSYKDYLNTEISKLDPSKSSDNSEYISIKTSLDLIELEEKYGANSWQARILQERMHEIVNSYNTCKYALEKNEETLKEAEEQYNKYIKLLDTGDWKYFAKTDLEDVQKQIKEVEEVKKITDNKSELSNLDRQLYELDVQKQVLDWRLNKNISYNSNQSRILDRYTYAQSNIYEYEHNNMDKTYEQKVEYQNTLGIANKYKYAIENDIKISTGNDFKGILEDLFSGYELFIVIIIVMIAGSIVSEEFSKGTVKLLLVKPYSRRKILLAKFITSLIMIIFTVVAILLMELVVGGIVFGFGELDSPTVVYNFNTNSVMEINTLVYVGINLLHKLPLYILLTTIAFAISTIIVSTPVAIVISLLGYMSTQIINALIMEFKIEFMKFFITPNWDLTQYLFGKLPSFEHINFNFSILICVLYFILLLIPTFVVFKKKNIKNV